MRGDLPSTYQGQDKRLHFVAGVGFGLIALAMGRTPFEVFVVGISAAAAAGAAKEALDAWATHTREESQHRVERADFTATVAGGIVGAAVAACLRWALG